MNKQQKKIFGGVLIVILLATIGAVLVSAETTNNSTMFKPMFGCKSNQFIQPIYKKLTEDQKQELHELFKDLKENDATPEEVRNAVTEKLESWDLDIPSRDEMLDQQIQNAQNHIEILERKKELREEGYEWDEIQEIIQEEFDLPIHSGSIMKHPLKHGGRTYIPHPKFVVF